jgi:Sec-independent protein translocase protein TatA
VTIGIGISEILLILILAIIFLEPSEMIKLVQRVLKIISRVRAEFRKFFVGN